MIDSFLTSGGRLGPATFGAGPWKALATWIIANRGTAPGELALAQLLSDTDAEVRSWVGYAFCYLPHISSPTYKKLEAAALNEPSGSTARAYLLGAAYIHAPLARKQMVKAHLLPYTKSTNKSEICSVCFALAHFSSHDDITLLEGLLTHDNPDVRICAADALLQCLKPK